MHTLPHRPRRLRALSSHLLTAGLLVGCSSASPSEGTEAQNNPGDDGATGGANPGLGSGGATGIPTGENSGGTLSEASGGSSASPVDCSGIVEAGHQLCSGDATECTAVFTDGSSCSEVCASAGLTCAGAFENVEDACAPDETRPAVACDSGHESDYCVCTGDGATGSGGTLGSGGESGSGGAASSGGATSTGGASGSGGASSSGGAASSGGASGSGGTSGVGPGPCGCSSPAGEFGTVNSTIVVEAGETYDGGCKIFRANPDTLGDGTQDEGQSPVFRVESGGTLKNVVLGASAADGIHLYGDVELENIHWLDIGEDAMTVKESGTVWLNCGSAAHGDDKVFQVNAASEIHISNFTASDAGKFMRQNGGTTFPVELFLDHCDISQMDEVIFRTDSTSSFVTMTNTRYSDLGTGLFLFGDDVVNGNSSQSSVSGNVEY